MRYSVQRICLDFGDAAKYSVLTARFQYFTNSFRILFRCAFRTSCGISSVFRMSAFREGMFEHSYADGFCTSFSPDPNISKIATSFVEPKRFFTARTVLKPP